MLTDPAVVHHIAKIVKNNKERITNHIEEWDFTQEGFIPICLTFVQNLDQQATAAFDLLNSRIIMMLKPSCSANLCTSLCSVLSADDKWYLQIMANKIAY